MDDPPFLPRGISDELNLQITPAGHTRVLLAPGHKLNPPRTEAYFTLTFTCLVEGAIFREISFARDSFWSRYRSLARASILYSRPHLNSAPWPRREKNGSPRFGRHTLYSLNFHIAAYLSIWHYFFGFLQIHLDSGSRGYYCQLPSLPDPTTVLKNQAEAQTVLEHRRDINHIFSPAPILGLETIDCHSGTNQQIYFACFCRVR